MLFFERGACKISVSYKIERSILELVVGDITIQETDAIVNAANSRLAPGGGVAGAIHRAAGLGLWEECKTLGGCKTGEAKITRGYNLAANHVIHTVGPIYSDRVKDPEDLSNCYRNSLVLAAQNQVKSISFPSISTGVFGYPVKDASLVAIQAIMDFLKNYPGITLVKMVLFSEDDYRIYNSTLEKIIKQ